MTDDVIPPRPVPLTPAFEAIPLELKRLKQWLCWAYELRDGRWTKARKRLNGKNASTTDPRSWSSFRKVEHACANGAGFDGPGLVTVDEDDLVFVDLDHTVDEAGNWKAWPLPIIDAATREGAYVEWSPSATGVHIIGRGAPLAKGLKKNGAEIYTNARFFTVTGAPVGVPPVTIGWLTETVQLVKAHISAAEPTATTTTTAPAAAAIAPLLDDDTLLAKARGAKNGAKFAALFDRGDCAEYPSPSEADLALATILAFWSGKDPLAIERLMRRSALVREKWTERETYLPDTIAAAVRQCSAVYRPAIKDYWAYLPEHKFIFIPTGVLWPAVSVNARVPPQHLEGQEVPASVFLDQTRAVEQMVWAPGEPAVIEDRLVVDGGWIHDVGRRAFNLYRPPTVVPGDPAQATRWVDLVHHLYGDSADHIIRWFAQRRQFPAIKINHGLVLGGAQGIGKDTILEPMKHAVGPWNFAEVSPQQMLGRFNPFVKSVVLRISEARDLGGSDFYSFYEHSKTYLAAPPDVLTCDEKNIRTYAVFNVMGVVFTSNNKLNGLYLPEDDRRHFVAWSELTRDDFTEQFWADHWRWYASGGIQSVVAYLEALDLSHFDPKAPPPKTTAWYEIVESARSPEEAELADAIDQLGRPAALTLQMLIGAADDFGQLNQWLHDRKNRRALPHKLAAVGYCVSRNPTSKDGYWIVHGARQAIYGRRELSERDRIAAAQEITRAP